MNDGDSLTRMILRTALFSLWLPLAVLAVTLVRLQRLPAGGDAVMLLALLWPTAVPLTLAVLLLHRRTRVTAYACAVVFGLLSVYATIVGGLFGPPFVVIYVAVVSLPAWIALGIVGLVHRSRRNPDMTSV